MRTVPYVKKVVNANTEYRTTSTMDTNWVLEQCKRLSDVAKEVEKHGIKEGQPLNTPNPKMPKMSTGKRNSAGTMCEGVVGNFSLGQYNLSDKQMDGLEEAFRIGNEQIEDFEAVVFEEVTALPKLKAGPAPIDTSNTTFGDLFNFEGFEVETITLRRKV